MARNSECLIKKTSSTAFKRALHNENETSLTRSKKKCYSLGTSPIISPLESTEPLPCESIGSMIEICPNQQRYLTQIYEYREKEEHLHRELDRLKEENDQLSKQNIYLLREIQSFEIELDESRSTVRVLKILYFEALEALALTLNTNEYLFMTNFALSNALYYIYSLFSNNLQF